MTFILGFRFSRNFLGVPSILKYTIELSTRRKKRGGKNIIKLKIQVATTRGEFAKIGHSEREREKASAFSASLEEPNRKRKIELSREIRGPRLNSLTMKNTRGANEGRASRDVFRARERRAIYGTTCFAEGARSPTTGEFRTSLAFSFIKSLVEHRGVTDDLRPK